MTIKKEIFKIRKEVTMMKKLIMLVMALAMVVAFMPKAQAADSAQLNLSVSFAPSEPLKIWSDPPAQFYPSPVIGHPMPFDPHFNVRWGETLEVKVIAEDKDTINVGLQPIHLPEGAEWIVDPTQPISANHREGLFRWTPKHFSLKDAYLSFSAKNSEGEEVKLIAYVNVTDPILSIELNESLWKVDGIGLSIKFSLVKDLRGFLHF